MEKSSEIIETVFSPRGVFKLKKNQKKYEVYAGGTLLFGTIEKISCRQLAKKTLNFHPLPENVLIGGLGMGFTLQQVLKNPEVKQVDVIEIEPQIKKWNNQFFSKQNGQALNDPRTRVIITDIIDYFKHPLRDDYDLIIIDIDNGPGNTIHPDNTYLYCVEMLKIIAELLQSRKPKGLVGIWSTTKEKWFSNRLNSIFKRTKEKLIFDPHKNSSPDYVYLAFI